jgi:two-component system sensor histidine kinase BaeS
MRLKIKYKMFSAFLFTSLMVSIGMFLFIQWSLDRGFLNYVNNQRTSELKSLSTNLIKEYGQHGNWEFLKNNNLLWHQLLVSSNGLPQMPLAPNGPGRPLPPQLQKRQESQPPPPPESAIRFALFSAAKEPIFSPPDEDENIDRFIMHPLKHEGEIIGYLALIPLKELSEAGDLTFIKQQTNSFALITFIMALLSLLISFLLTTHLLRPVKALTFGTRNLMAGHYKTRIPIISSDELGQLSTDFNSLAITLEKNEQARQQWVADISHELRTPLAVLRGEIEALQDGIRKPTSQMFETLHSETMHIGRLVEDLYELSMSDIGALNYKMVEVDPLGILRGALELYEHRFSEKGLQLKSYLPLNLSILLVADPDRLQQLFSNLLANSLRYTNTPGQLVVKIKSDKQRLYIYFEDSAPGVSLEHRKMLFNRLYRVESSRNRANGGAGLGLSICKNIIEAHQGEITIDESSLGGIKVTVILPLAG